MGIFFKKETMYICPEVNGKITFEGRPLVNQKVTLLAYCNKEKLFHTQTDDEGRFHFDECIIKSSAPHYSPKLMLAHAIYTNINDKKYLLWYAIIDGLAKAHIKDISDVLSNLCGDLSEDDSVKRYIIFNEHVNKKMAAQSVLDLGIERDLELEKLLDSRE